MSENIIKEAVALREQGNFSDAITLLERSIGNHPDVLVLTLLSHCHILNNNLQRGEDYLKTAKAIEPEHAYVLINEARISLKK